MTGAKAPLSQKGCPVSHQGTKEYGGAMHYLLFALLLIGAAIDFAHFSSSQISLFVLNGICGVASFVLVILALVRQRVPDLPGSVKKITWAVLVTLSGTFVFNYCYSLFHFIRNKRPEVLENQWTLFSAMAEIKPSEHPIIAKMYLAYAVTTFICGIWGLVAMAMRRRKGRSIRPFVAQGVSGVLHGGGNP